MRCCTSLLLVVGGLFLSVTSTRSAVQDPPEPKLPPVTTRAGVIQLKDFNEALEYLGHELQWKQLVACASLARCELYKPRQAEVAKALEKLLGDRNALTANRAAQALAVWATRDQMASLIAALDSDDPFIREAMYEALGTLQDPRGVAPVAKALAKFSDRKWAVRALTRMGPIVEDTMRKYLKDSDTAVREAAAKVLEKIGKTGKDDKFLEVMTGLTKGDGFARNKSLQWLTTADLTDAQQVEVARTVAPLLMKGDGLQQRWAAEILERCATHAQVPAIVEALQDNRIKLAHHKPLLRALTRLKDDRAIPVLTEYLTGNAAYANEAAPALIAIGPLAEPDVLPLLEHDNVLARLAACKVLRAIGTEKSLKPLQAAIDRCSNQDKFKGGAQEVVSTGKAAIKAIEARAAK
jgi:HEAT repeat protein